MSSKNIHFTVYSFTLHIQIIIMQLLHTIQIKRCTTGCFSVILRTCSCFNAYTELVQSLIMNNGYLSINTKHYASNYFAFFFRLSYTSIAYSNQYKYSIFILDRSKGIHKVVHSYILIFTS